MGHSVDSVFVVSMGSILGESDISAGIDALIC